MTVKNNMHNEAANSKKIITNLHVLVDVIVNLMLTKINKI